MGRFWSFVLVGVLASVVACQNPGEPATERQALLREIVVPASASRTDTIRVAFRYEIGSCQAVERYAVTRTLNELSAAVFVRVGGLPRGSACADRHLEPAVLVVAPPFHGPFTVRLQQPSGDDSVFVVQVR